MSLSQGPLDVSNYFLAPPADVTVEQLVNSTHSYHLAKIQYVYRAHYVIFSAKSIFIKEGEMF